MAAGTLDPSQDPTHAFRPSEPGSTASAVLAVTVHLLFALVLVFGLRWTNRPPENISVEMWDQPVSQRVEPQPVQEVKPEPRPPEPVPKVEPKVEAKPVPPPPPVQKAPAKADIAIEREKKAPPKAKPEEPKVQNLRIDLDKQLKEQLAREMGAVVRPQAAPPAVPAQAAGGANAKQFADYVSKISQKIKSHQGPFPADLSGNPEVLFDVVQLPTGEVLSVKMTKSSGNRAYDEVVERAIYKSSPLPRPDRADLFQRELRLRFTPQDK
jgi:colicin import membrane protein